MSDFWRLSDGRSALAIRLPESYDHVPAKGYDWDAIRQKYRLSEVVGKSVDLKKRGSEYVGLCPFHNERTPSFHVIDDKEFYHCFGCGAHGDVVEFVSQHEGVDTRRAVEILTGGESVILSDNAREERRIWLEQRDQQERELRQRAIEKARKRWDSAPRMEGNNAYLEHKGVPPHCARMENGKLLLPVYDSEGEIQNVQTIEMVSATQNEKRFQKGAPVPGGRMYVGVYSGRVIICEGFATGASIYAAMPEQVCVAYMKSNIEAVARDLKSQGVNIAIAADREAIDQMRRLAHELDCPVLIPQDKDFNDQHKNMGIDSVRQSISEGMLAHQHKSKEDEEPFCAISFIDAFDYNEADIPLRPWLVPGALMEGCTHILAAPGGTGKSLFTLQFAIMLATGEPWGRWAPRKACNVLIVNAEDDVPEQRRRLSAARAVMGLRHDFRPKGKLLMADNPSSILTAGMDEKTKRLVPTPLVAELAAVIRHHSIDVVVVDPFAETFEGDENSNNDTKWAMKTWRDDIARATGCAVYLVHHTTKNAGDKAGSSDAVRGAGALVNSARLASTLFVMDKQEAGALDIPEEERFRYVKYDDAKSNQSLIGSRQWFKKISVRIQNGIPGHSDSGDEVGALEPWEPGNAKMAEAELLTPFLSALKEGYVDPDGVPTEEPYTPSKRGGSPRWVGYLMMRIFDINEDQAKRMITDMEKRGTIQILDHHDAMRGHVTKGVFPGDYTPTEYGE